MSRPSILGQRGYVLALALFGAHALQAVAQESEVTTDSKSMNHDADIMISIYGSSPLMLPVALPPIEILYAPYLGTWALEPDNTVSISIAEDGYTIYQDGNAVEQGQFSLTQESENRDGVRKFTMTLSDRVIKGIVAPNTQETWIVSEDQNIFKRTKDKKAVWRRITNYSPAKK